MKAHQIPSNQPCRKGRGNSVSFRHVSVIQHTNPKRVRELFYEQIYYHDMIKKYYSVFHNRVKIKEVIKLT